MPKFITRLLPLLILLIGLSACVSLAEDITPPPGYQAPTAQQSTPTAASPVYPVLPPDPARGAPLFAEKCAPCHGDAGLGDGPDAAMLSNPVAPLGDPALARLAAPDDWYMMVTKGNMQNFMPPFASLSVPERWDVIAYAYTLSTPPDEIALGQALFNENCAICHGERGRGDGPEAGALTASPINFTDQEFMGARSAADLFDSITNGLGEMHSFAGLAEADRWALTAYLRTLTFAETGADTAPEGDLTETPVGEATPEVTPPTEDATVETPPETPAQPGTGTVNLQVQSASGAVLPSDLEVTLYGYEGMTQVYSNTFTLAEDGTASVTDVPMPVDQYIFATFEYGGILYGSDIAVVEPDMVSLDIVISYYEKTTDSSVVKADRLHVFYDFATEGKVQVYVLYIFSNASSQVLTAENPQDAAIAFTLPAGATNLQRDTGMDFQDFDLPNGFGIQAVYPSPDSYQVMYSFDLPYEKNKVDFDLPIAMDTTAAIVMAPANGVKIKSDQLVDAGMQDIEGISYSIYNGSSLKTGDLLTMAISGQPKASTVTGEGGGLDTSTSLVIGLVFFGVALIGAGLYLWRRNRTDDDELDDEEDTPEADTPEDLMDAIIALDDLYQSGDIPADAYEKRRAELKERLQKVMGAGG
ncbi:MAG TPA: hypothetical protein DEH25_13775 [Chloroflexi bacterium]|nr:hypothetical protein [Chloroflexota bacterium]